MAKVLICFAWLYLFVTKEGGGGVTGKWDSDIKGEKASIKHLQRPNSLIRHLTLLISTHSKYFINTCGIEYGVQIDLEGRMIGPSFIITRFLLGPRPFSWHTQQSSTGLTHSISAWESLSWDQETLHALRTNHDKYHEGKALTSVSILGKWPLLQSLAATTKPFCWLGSFWTLSFTMTAPPGSSLVLIIGVLVGLDLQRNHWNQIHFTPHSPKGPYTSWTPNLSISVGLVPHSHENWWPSYLAEAILPIRRPCLGCVQLRPTQRL